MIAKIGRGNRLLCSFECVFKVKRMDLLRRYLRIVKISRHDLDCLKLVTNRGDFDFCET